MYQAMEQKPFHYFDEKSIPEHLLCPLCFHPLVSPVEHSQCHQVFCEKCVSGIKNCPICRSGGDYSPVKLKILVTALDELKVFCPNPLCEQKTVSRGSFFDHFEKCPIGYLLYWFKFRKIWNILSHFLFLFKIVLWDVEFEFPQLIRNPMKKMNVLLFLSHVPMKELVASLSLQAKILMITIQHALSLLWPQHSFNSWIELRHWSPRQFSFFFFKN